MKRDGGREKDGDEKQRWCGLEKRGGGLLCGRREREKQNKIAKAARDGEEELREEILKEREERESG